MKSGLLIILLATLAISCNKKEDPAPNGIPQESPDELLTGKKWQMSGFSANPAIDWDGAGTYISDIFPLLDTCERIQIVFYTLAGHYFITEGDTSCQTYTSDTLVYGTWRFNTGKDSLTRMPEGGCCSKPRAMKVDLLTKDVLQLSYTVPEQDGMRTYTEVFRSR